MKKMGNSVRSMILYLTAAFVYVPRRYLLSLTAHREYASREVKYATEMQYIKAFSVTERANHRDSSEQYYQITPKGLEYLAKKSHRFPDEMKWVGNLLSAMEQCQLLRERSVRGHIQMRRYLSISGAAVFSAAAGFRVNAVTPRGQIDGEELSDLYIDTLDNDDFDLWLSEEETDIQDGAENKSEMTRTTQGRIIENLLEKAGMEQRHNGAIINKRSAVSFTSVYEMKKRIGAVLGAGHTHSGGRFTGVVESPFKSVLLYEGKKDGVGWSKWLTDIDLQVYRIYKARVSENKNYQLGMEHGAMLVNNAKMFAELLLNKRGKMKPNEKFANGFSSFMMFPISSMGVRQFAEYMRTDIQMHRARLVADAVDSGLYQRNIGGYANLFPLKTYDGTLMAVGTFMDAVMIQKILDSQTGMSFPFGMICYDWQQDFYCRIFSEDVMITTVQ